MKILTKPNYDSVYQSHIWYAVYEGYDWENDDPVGYGATEQEAIDNLKYEADLKGWWDIYYEEDTK